MKKKYSSVEINFTNEEGYLQSNVVYLITFPDGKYYIGSTTMQLSHRIAHHCSAAIKDNEQYLISLAIREFMKFEVKILDVENDVDELRELENNYTKKYKSDEREFGYNTDSGTTHSNETKLKMSESQGHPFFDDYNNQFRSLYHAAEYYKCGNTLIRHLLKTGKKSKKLGTSFHYIGRLLYSKLNIKNIIN